MFDKFDFFEFFESDPTVIGTEKDGRLQYFYQTENKRVIVRKWLQLSVQVEDRAKKYFRKRC